jgi:hypothetical protein
LQAVAFSAGGDGGMIVNVEPSAQLQYSTS